MALIDHITDAFAKIAPSKLAEQSTVHFDDDNLIVSKATIVFHGFQIFFNFLAMACFAGVAAFQAKWGVGPSGLSGFALFIAISGMLQSALMLTVPVIYEKYDKLVRAARALKEVRVAFILTGTGVAFSLLIAFITTISAWTEPGCKDPANDPHAKQNGEVFQSNLPGWCNAKKAGAVFFWLAFVFWTASLGLLIYYWRTGRLNTTMHMMIAPNEVNSPFADPHRHGSTTAYNGYPTVTPVVPSAGRPSLDAYGAFSDPAPSGFINPSGFSTGPTQSTQLPIPIPDHGPRVSRTMQYADPYAAVRATLAGQGSPPSYESYSGYR
ncbi:hypothetical protein F5887DRAFT_1270513 [Amanita rubescens]|nr:hypothetical protein F5887DRAFT_1270513 [Amanita rubescens]